MLTLHMLLMIAGVMQLSFGVGQYKEYIVCSIAARNWEDCTIAIYKQKMPILHLLLMACRYDVPLVADIHFQPVVASMVAECFEKIRVNPGNFVDGRKRFDEKVYDDDSQFKQEQEHIREVRRYMHRSDQRCSTPTSVLLTFH